MRPWLDAARDVPGAPRVRALRVSAESYRRAAEATAACGGQLVALWGDRDAQGTARVSAALAAAGELLIVELPVPERGTLGAAAAPADYPGIEDLHPAAERMQRAVADLEGLRSTAADRRPWLRHGPEGGAAAGAGYAFVRVHGDGVHEIPVGPVHAGIIEPGHFRFSVVGEKVLRLEERLGYAHKGIEQRFLELPILAGCRLAARVSGDSAVGFSWAYAQALEGQSGSVVPPRAAWLRALCLELERIANHLGDLGALGNDAGFAFGLAQFSRLKELLLRAQEHAFGQRYLLDVIVPGGMRRDLDAGAGARLRDCVGGLAREAAALRTIYEEHAGLRGRFVGAGIVTPALAAELGLTGLAGRASGQARDLRVDAPWVPYTECPVRRCGHDGGDVAARVAVRFDELSESCRLVALLLRGLPPGDHSTRVPTPDEGAFGVGFIEAWRGPVLVALTAGRDGAIRRCHPHDPSWQNWPVLEHAIIDNIVPDFPLINKSFNLSYSGHDL
jgi:Ni,Fe-hydrogenase III large subunit